MRRLLEEGGDGEPLIGFTKNLMIFRKSGLLLTSRLMEGNYPNYQQVIPKEGGKKITVNRSELESALRRVSVLSKDKANAVKVSFASDKMTLFSSNPDFGEATEELPARYEGEPQHRIQCPVSSGRVQCDGWRNHLPADGNRSESLFDSRARKPGVQVCRHAHQDLADAEHGSWQRKARISTDL